MNKIVPLKLFGKGQVTLPKVWREKFQTEYFLAEVTPQGLLIKPLQESVYYEFDDDNFGLHFPTGIKADKLAKLLKKANERLS